ncbi:sigma factor-like helix-turn-helix DNA-binding protein [Virgibacillus sp. W0430]|uniref:sigma factor-like helix-turn-helix DNA-binding protein n=1 Tax=Virgibacillus sp. W0430 TaxID=3391580 RepID=UPI003F44A6E9
MWADKLIGEYEQGRRDLRHMLSELGDSIEDKQDKKQINSMTRDMSYSIDWLKIGKEPGSLRGLDRRSIYQRRVLMDMDLFPSLEIEPKQHVSEEQKQAIIDILVVLSVRERQCFILHNAYEMSMAHIGEELNISKSSVQTFINRANEKINKKILSYDCHTVAN